MADYGVRITLAASSPEPTYNVAPFVSGVAKFSAGAAASGWTSGQIIEVSPVGERVDIAQGGNYAEVSSFDCTLTATWWLAFQAAGASLFGAVVEVGSLVGATFTPRWSGVVSDNSWQGAELRITAESLITLRHKLIPSRILTTQEFPSIPSESEGLPVPIIYGAVERLRGPATLSDKDYLAGIGVDGDRGRKILSATFIATGGSIPATTATNASVVISISDFGYNNYLPGYGDNSDSPRSWYTAMLNGDTVYMEIVDGTGSGQERLVTPVLLGLIYSVSGQNTTTYAVQVTAAAPFDTAPDVTSRIRFYAQPIGASVVVGDEATVSRVEVDVDGRSYPIAHVQGELSAGIVSADVSAEFRFGEDYAAIEYHRPDEVRGVEEIRDGLTASAAETISALPYGVGNGAFDAVAFCEVYGPNVCSSLDGDDATLYAFVSASSTLPIKLHASAIRWDGTQEVIDGAIDLGGTSVNNYPEAILPDGTPGAFGIRPISLPLSRPIEEYEVFRLAVYMVGAPTIATRDPVLWTNGASVVQLNAATGVVGNWVRPVRASNAFQDQTIDVGSIIQAGQYGGDVRNWRIIQSRVEVTPGVYNCTLDYPISCATGNYGTVSVDPSELVDISQFEMGIGAAFGSIPRTSQFLASTSAGRTYSGSPVTLARDVARDIFRRDLSVPLADTTAYSALPDDHCSMALVEAEQSDVVIARMCREFNWVAGHNQAGQEVATAWLSRLFSATSDYSVTSSDMVAGSITGLDSTALDDLVTLSSLRWDWTQADGYRQQGAVTEVSSDPSSLTAENYLATISGFGDFSTSLDAYQILHGAWQASGLRRADEIEYRYGGDPLSLYIPARMEWAALRKDIATFRINDTHPAASAYVGQRIAVSHKRYTAGGTGYGTLVATYWYPAEGQVQLTVMFDPAQVVITDGQLYVDTIDPTEATPLYIDQLDGVSTQHIDTLGV